MFSNKYRYFFIALLGGYSFLNIKFTEGDKVLTTNLGNVWLFALILILTILVWEGNRLFQNSTFASNSLPQKLVLRFFLSIVLVTTISIVSSYIVGQTLNTATSLPGFKQTLGFTFRINLFLHCINAIYQYNKALSDSRLETERLKKQSTEAQLEALRNQVNPHFLFNSLNVLTSVIESDKSLGVKYVNELSKVYRYLLRSEKEHLVSLDDEISFLESYIFLLKIRFQKNLEINMNLQEAPAQRIPPSTLQLLIENAIKHNEVSKKNPLTISIKQENGHIVVHNNMNLRSERIESSGVGLENIKNRYLLLTSMPPLVEKSEEHFLVRLPVIDNERTDH